MGFAILPWFKMGTLFRFIKQTVTKRVGRKNSNHLSGNVPSLSKLVIQGLMNSLQTIWDEPFPFVTVTKSLQLTHSAIATQKIKNKCSLHFPLWFSKIIAENTWVLAQTRGGAVLPVFWKRQYHLPFFSLLFSPLKGNYSPVAIRQSSTASLVEVGEVTLADVRVLNRFRLLFAPEARERCSGGCAALCFPISQALASSLALLSGDTKPRPHPCRGHEGKAPDNTVASKRRLSRVTLAVDHKCPKKDPGAA